MIGSNTLFSGSNWNVFSKSAFAASQSLRARCASPKQKMSIKWGISVYDNDDIMTVDGCSVQLVQLATSAEPSLGHTLILFNSLDKKVIQHKQNMTKLPSIFTLSQTPLASIHCDILRWHIARLSLPAWRRDFLSSSASPFREISCSRKSITCVDKNIE